MRRKRQLLLGATVVGIVVLLFLAFRSEPQPSYGGHSLSYWVEGYWLGGPDQEAALRAIGTNAFPFLLHWMQQKQPGYQALLFSVAIKLPDRLRPKWADGDYIPLSLASAHALAAYGLQASPLIPEISRLAADPNEPEIAETCLSALSYVGSNGVPPLLAAIQDPSHPYRASAAYKLGLNNDLGPFADTVITQLVAQLHDPTVAREALDALGDLKIRPDIVVPALANSLQSTNQSIRVNAAISLNWFEEKAAPALPALTNALNDPDPEVRKFVGDTILQINAAIARAKLGWKSPATR